ncbi:MAG TPA: maleylpyruvate isomerase N-terminal domain-containing protein [Nocardioidaceae bacterium]|jgi:uncharacterized protein (TIGR03083 family)
MTTHLVPARYFELIDKDTDRLIEMGERGLKEPVPACPGWDVAEVVWHVANVYEHKVRVMADNAWPDPWPPTWEFADDEELAFLRSAKTHLFEEFSRHEVTEQTQTFGEDTTVGFWVRRMACEIAVHRTDGEQAHTDPTPIPDDLSLDGIDEMLRVMLAGPWWADRVQTDHPVEALVAVESGGRRWLCDVREKAITVTDDAATEAAATVSGRPMDVFLWLWGRAGDDSVTFTGDVGTAHEFRARLVECAG